jgi:hypothetical protein
MNLDWNKACVHIYWRAKGKSTWSLHWRHGGEPYYFRTFWLITLWGPSRMSYGLVKLFFYHIYISSYSIPDRSLRVWVSTLSALFMDFGWRRTIWWITPQKLLIPGWSLVCVYPYYYYTLPYVRFSNNIGIGTGIWVRFFYFWALEALLLE